MAAPGSPSGPTPSSGMGVPDVPTWVKGLFSLSVLTCLYLSFVSSSTVGSGIGSVSGGVFSSSGTMLSPAGTAFVIWSLIYLGFFTLSLRIWMPGSSGNLRRRLLLPPAIVTVVADTAWIMCANLGFVWATLPLMLIVVASVVWTLESIRLVPAPDVVANLGVEGTFGLHLGWALVATGANVLVAVQSLGLDPTGPTVVALALTLLVVSGVACAVATVRYHINWGVPLAFTWGLVWLIRARTHAGPNSWLVVVIATVCAVGVLGWPFARRLVNPSDARPALGASS